MLSGVEHEKSFITLRPELIDTLSFLKMLSYHIEAELGTRKFGTKVKVSHSSFEREATHDSVTVKSSDG